MAPIFDLYDLTAIDSVNLAIVMVAVAFVFLIFIRDTD